MIRVFSILLLVFVTMSVYAKITRWEIIPKESQLSFQAIQNDAPVEGYFETFSGEVFFDKNVLAESHVNIEINMGSVNADYEDLVITLQEADWFDVLQYPMATFSAKNFIQLPNGDYQGDGILTIRDQSHPVKVTFTLPEYSETRAVAKGSVETERLLYGIGQGEWQSTEEVKNQVVISFTLAVKK